MPADRTVVLEHVVQDEDYRTPLDPHTGKTMFGERITDRAMSMEVTLAPFYSPRCAYTLEVSWLVASSVLISEWTSSFFDSATRSKLKAVRVPCRRGDAELGDPLQAAYVAKPIPDFRLNSIFRESIIRKLIASHGYFPDSVVVDRHCRLIHSTGLSMVSTLGDGAVVWRENDQIESGSQEQFAQWKTFCAVEREARKRAMRVDKHIET
jgi:hypothetical protein